jgi:hypothetical protein
MKLGSVEAIVRALNDEGVRFIVVGGVAVNAHGYARFTADLDLVVHLGADNVHAAFRALESLGYRPRVPVKAEQFSDKQLRERMIQEKGMQVLQFWSEQHRETSVDVFVTEPFDFEVESARASPRSLGAAGPVPIASIRTLIAMKELAGRDEDILDIKYLRMRLEDE